MKEKLVNIYENTKIRNNLPTRIGRQEQMNVHFAGHPFVEIYGDKNNNNYTIVFIDKDKKEIVYQEIIKINHWVKVKRKWFTNYQIRVLKDNKPLYVHDYNAKGKRVYINLDSKSLGDTLAWIPYVEEFRKKHQCKVLCSTFWNNLFDKQYKNIEFVKPWEELNNIYAMYTIGINVDDPYKNKNDYRTIPLQQVASDMLGLDFFEIRPKVNHFSSVTKRKNKYVCISKHSTAQAKYWNNPTGWQEVVNYLISKNYSVVSVAKEGCDLNNVKVIKDKSIEEIIPILNGCEFFIGLPSGLSWLAWSLGKKVIMISGFSKPWYEFTENNYYVHFDNGYICTGCFVDTFVKFDKGDWNWCPYHKGTPRQFECTKKITSQMVIEQIELLNKLDRGSLTDRDLNILTREICTEKIYDKYLSISEDSIVVDLGATIGLYSISCLTEKKAKICYCVEPFPRNVIALKNNLSFIDNNKYEIIEYAINDDMGNIGYSSEKNWVSFIKEKGDNTDEKFEIISFKNFLDKYKIDKIDILKMDIEGSEHSIFSKKENMDFIKNNVMNVVGEIHFSFFNNEQREDIINAMNYLKDNGFKVIFNSVDGFDITNNIFQNMFLSNKNKKSFDYYRQFLFYCIKEKEHNLLIVGTPRSGTFFTFELVVKLLGKAEHEKYNDKFNIHNIISWEMAFDNWGNNPELWGNDVQHLFDIVSYKDFKKVLHQVRHPLKTISSLLMVDDWFWKMASKKINNLMGNNKLKMAMKVWYEWNVQCEKIADITYRVEDITKNLDRFCELIGSKRKINMDFKKINKNSKEDWFNSKNGDKYKDKYKEITWKDLDNTDLELSNKIKELSEKYGYNISERN